MSPVLTTCVEGHTTSHEPIKWLQHPGWQNGLLLQWSGEIVSASPALATHLATAVQEQLPPPSNVTSHVMHELTDRVTSDYTVVTSDVSGNTLASFLAAQDYTGARSSRLQGFNHQPENACSSLQSQPTGPLHPRTYLLLMYRTDVLAALQAAGAWPAGGPPDSWEELEVLLEAHAAAAAARALTRPAGSRLPTHGLCITTDPTCGRLGDVWAAIAGSVLQTRGTAQGYVYDLTFPPPAAVHLTNGTGWRHAADTLHRLLRYNAPEDPSQFNCWGVSPSFLAGDCLITLEWDAALPLMGSAPPLQQGLGVAPLPGSHLVAARQAAAGGGEWPLVPCSAELCAVSANHDLLYLESPAGSTGAASPSATPYTSSALHVFAAREAAAVARLETSPPALLNRAPFSAAFDAAISFRYLAVGLDPTSIADVAVLQRGVLDRLDSFRFARQSFTDQLRVPLGYTVRSSGDAQNCSGYADTDWWTVLPPEGAAELVGMPDVRPLAAATGLADSGAAADYLRALWHAIHSPNAAPDMQSPVPVNWMKYALSHAALLLLPPAQTVGTNSSAPNDTPAAATSVDAAVALLARLFADIGEAFGASVIRQSYVASISAPPWQPPSEEPSRRSLDSGQIAATTVSAAVALVVLVASTAALVSLGRRRNRNMLGRVVAPRAGPDTTLLITDVQSSTVLWEALPVAVMDTALQLHHATIRRVLAAHDGYESATEGDSFIAAFADPASAVAFATACQVALMFCDWPVELLGHPDAALLVVAAPQRPQEGGGGAHSGGGGRGRGGALGALMSGLGLGSVSGAEPREGRPLSAQSTASRRLVCAPTDPLAGTPPGSGSVTRSPSASGRVRPALGAASRSARVLLGSRPDTRATTAEGVVAESDWGDAVLTSLPALRGPLPTRAALEPDSAGPGAWTAVGMGVGVGMAPGERHGANCDCGCQDGIHDEMLCDLFEAEHPGLAAAGLASRDASRAPRGLSAPAVETFLLAEQHPAASAAASPIRVSNLPTGPLAGPMAVLTAPSVRGGSYAPGMPVGSTASNVSAAAGRLQPQWGSRQDLDSGPRGQAPSSFAGSLRQTAAVAIAGPRCSGSGMSPAAGVDLSMSAQRPGWAGGLGSHMGSNVGGHISRFFNPSQQQRRNTDTGNVWMPPWGLGLGLESLDDIMSTEGGREGGRSGRPVCCTFGEALAAAFVPVELAGTGNDGGGDWQAQWRAKGDSRSVVLPCGRLGLVAFRGLRVRMGLHTGLEEGGGHMMFNKVGSSFKYYGPFAETARLVSDAASGGLVTLSGAAFARLRHSISRTSSGGRAVAAAVSDGTLVVYAGHYQMANGQGHPAGAGPPGIAAHALPMVSMAMAVAESREDAHASGQSPPAHTTAAEVLAAATAVAPNTPAGGLRAGVGGVSNVGADGSVPDSLEDSDGGSPTIAQTFARASLNAVQKSAGTAAVTPPTGGGLFSNHRSLLRLVTSAASPSKAEAPPGSALAGGPARAPHSGPLPPRPPPPAATSSSMLAGHHSLFVAVPSALACRLVLAPSLRCGLAVQLGTLAAPIGCITVAFVKVVGASTLLADLPAAAGRALDHFQSLACELLGAAGGFLVEGGDGLVLAAFALPAAGVVWALDCLAELRSLVCEEELLSHELCAEELAPGPAAGGGQEHRQRQGTALQRGLRIKVGLDTGPATHSLTEASGRLSYRGKVMNRAARIAGIAVAGQVLCSGAVWDAARPDCGVLGNGVGGGGGRVVGLCLGRMALKGIHHPIQVVQCVRE